MKSTKISRGVLSVAALGLAAVFISSPAIAATPDAAPLPVVHVTTSDGAIAPASVSGCTSKTVPGGKQYTGCEVYTWVGWWSMSFKADFTIVTNGRDRIDAIRDAKYSVDAFHRATSSYSFTIGKKTEDAQGAAWARYTQGFTATTGDATKWVGIWVGGDTWGQNNAD